MTIALIVSFLVVPVFADNPFATPHEDFLNRVVGTADGGFIVVGRTDSTGTNRMDGWVVKIGANGAKEWEFILPSSNGSNIEGIVQTKSRDFLVVGSIKSDPQRTQLWIAKLSRAGKILWKKTMGDEKYNEYGTNLIEAKDGSIVVSAVGHAIFKQQDAWVICLDRNGQLKWDLKFGDRYDESSGGIIQGHDGSFFVAGTSEDPDRPYNRGIVSKISPRGKRVWTKIFAETKDQALWPIKVAGRNDFWSAGFIIGPDGQYDWWIVKMNSEGNVLLNQTFAKPGYDELNSLGFGGKGSAVLAGNRNNVTTAMKIDASGRAEWETALPTYLYAPSIAKLTDGSYVIVGTFWGESGSDGMYVRLNSNGKIIQ